MKNTLLMFLTCIAFNLRYSTNYSETLALLKHSLGLLDDTILS